MKTEYPEKCCRDCSWRYKSLKGGMICIDPRSPYYEVQIDEWGGCDMWYPTTILSIGIDEAVDDIIRRMHSIDQRCAKLRKELQASAEEIMGGKQMKNEAIEVLFYPVNPDEQPSRRLLAPDPEGGLLKTMQNVVGGFIEVIPHPDKEELLIVLDEEGKMKSKGYNRPLRFKGSVHDYIAGEFFICRKDGEDMVSLTEEDIEWLLNEDVEKRNDGIDTVMDIVDVSYRQYYEGVKEYHFFDSENPEAIEMALMDMQQEDKEGMPLDADGREFYFALPWKFGIFIEIKE